ncbi:eukaryotic translation initiation factor 2 subunit 2-like isoform X3 [Portunus trituberculatus]|uniref:eukaryotic translation initiation factor 2 subunit 2-like isoform X3 n=1 Tax=Portunus trituberculatus TaxID=210409 RepID=UPI001E1CC9DD|nr:eukaryotic translation initiation factor 2 subunit 2-like isoform X3 [Portunus trituberculatus]
MAEEECIFDPNLKKKKKKKTGFNLDAALAEGSGAPEPAPTPENGEVQEAKESTPEMDDMEMYGKKKSKKKKKPFSLDEMSDALPETKDNGVAAGEDREPPAIQAAEVDDFDLDMDFTRTKKKKTKKKKVLNDLIAKDEVAAEADDKELESGDGWVGSERDYTYDELLERAFNQLREKNPEMATGEKKKFIMKPPQVVRIGSKKTAFANFAEICRLLHRMPKHVLQFLLAELGTSGSTDGSNQLIIKGRFQQKQIENVLRRYIKEYVTCHTCRSPDTILQKDARLYFLQCEQCNSRCSVAPIKSGFQAVANKQQRQAIRASKN